jgi:hypothetical protein
MKRNFYTNDFEQFLQQKAEQYQMYPSEKVWDNIDNALHKNKRRRFLGGLLLLLLGTGSLLTNEIITSKYRKLAIQLNQHVPVAPPYFFNNSEQIAAHKVKSNNNYKIAVQFRRVVPTNNNDNKYNAQNVIVPYNPLFIMSIENAIFSTDNVNVVNSSASVAVPEISSAINKFPQQLSTTNVFDDTAEKAREDATSVASDKEEAVNEKIQEMPLEQFSVSNIAAKKAQGKWSVIMHASPIVSYRKLVNSDKLTQAAPVAVNFSNNVDAFVNHKPAIGFEIGAKAQYNLSRKFLVQTGLQLNYSRYNINAYKYYEEKATVTLRRASVDETIAAYTSIRNFEGYNKEYLQNQYLQLSVPIGAEMVVLGKKRLQLNVAASVQPSYLLGSTSYLITPDYKNYIQKPDLTRKWNLHTNLEAFVSYKVNGVRWQFGPQFRYQTLSSYADEYPIREYITEYGFKLGISKLLQ